MFKNKKEKLKEFQQLIKYEFINEELLVQALTTPLFGNENNAPHYDILETLGDAVIKTILISKKIKDTKGEINPEIITKTKQAIENNESLAKIAEAYFHFEKYIFKAKNQDLKIKDKKILADVLEAVCGALYLDSNNLNTVDDIIISKFYDNWDSLIEDSTIFNKNKLLEYLQQTYRITPEIELQYESSGPDNDLLWVAKNPKILNINIDLPFSLKSMASKSKKEAEKDLYKKILDYLKENIF